MKAGSGIGVIEAPRGTLYYALKTNEAGMVDYINLVIPTAQNHQNIEKDVAKLVQEQLDAGAGQDAISLEAEKLIRAYDPRMSCATHFLKLKIREAAASRLRNSCGCMRMKKAAGKGGRRTKQRINPWTFAEEGKR